MPFQLRWTKVAEEQYSTLKVAAEKAKKSREARRRTKSSKQEGLFKQVAKTISLLKKNPRHPSLQCHEYSDLPHPYDRREKVWEAYAQNKTPSAYRVFWCHGPGRENLTIITITPHP